MDPLMFNQIGKGLSSISTGATIGSAIPGIGTAIGAGAGALVGLISSLFSGDSEQSDFTKRLMDQIDKVQGYSKSQINRSVATFNRAGATAIAGAANDYAVGAAGRQNFVNAAVAKMLPSVAMLGAQRQAKMEDYNEELPLVKIRAKAGLLGGLNPDTPQEDFLSLSSLALSGAKTGLSYDMSKNRKDFSWV